MPSPTNGFVTYSPDTTAPFDYLTMATYGCNTGYGLLAGDRMRSCIASSQGGGEWSGTAPVCDGMESQYLNVTHNFYLLVSADD